MRDANIIQDFINSIPSPALCVNKLLSVQACNGEFAKLFGSTSCTCPLKTILFTSSYTTESTDADAEISIQLLMQNNVQQFLLLNTKKELVSVTIQFSPIKLGGLEDYFLLILQPYIAQDSSDLFEIYKSVFNRLNRGIFISNFNADGKGQHGHFVEVNDVACQQLGYSRGELLKMNARSINPNSNAEAIKAIGRNLKRDGEAQFHAIHVGKDGKHHSVNVIAKLIYANDNTYVLSICDYQDNSSQTVDIERSRFGRLMELSWDEIYVFATETLIIDQANTGALDNLGYSRYEINQLKITDLLQDISENTFKRLTKSLFDGSKSQVVLESVFQRKDGTEYPVEIRIQLSHSEVPPIYLANVQNISERKATENNLLFLANHDSLTGLFNRNMFMSKLNEAIEQCKRSETLMAVLFLDLDGFKYINDTMGHDTGDKLIQETAKRLTDSVRNTDIVSRMGGDEFTAILTNIKHTSDIITVAKKIIKNIAAPCKLNGHHIQTTCSLGITVYPFTDADNAYTLTKQADTAMYQAKDMGKNTYSFFAATLAQQERNLRQLESDLKTALKENQYKVYFQSKVNLETREIYGAEALIRWPNEKYPNISPADFIPILEASDQIKQVDMWVFHQTCSQLKQWLNVNPELVISINLSAKHFSSKTLVKDIKKILKETGVPAQNLEIEITEGVLISKTQHAEKLLRELKALGFNISLDDFGSGYSSLSYLKQLPINRLKIDRAFVYDLENNKDSRMIIEAIVNLADSMDLSVIAEGIETESQVNVLTELNCFEGQGYLFSKPCPADDFFKLLQTD